MDHSFDHHVLKGDLGLILATAVEFQNFTCNSWITKRNNAD